MSLTSDEHVLYETRLSKRLFVGPLLLSIAAVAGSFACRAFVADYGHLLFWALIATAIVVLIPSLARYYSSHYVVTDQRVIIRHGFLARTSYEMILQKIESITVNQTLSDRFIWGSGTVIIKGTGGTDEPFKDVGSAISFQEHLNEALHKVNREE